MSSSFISPKVATNDIEVYKILRVLNESISSPCFSGFNWKLGIQYEANVCFKDTKRIIHEGFHSLRECPKTDKYRWLTIDNKDIFIKCTNDRIFKAVIPKGSTYYENEYGEIVSNKLKLLYGCN
jgi:hypothetical protein